MWESVYHKRSTVLGIGVTEHTMNRMRWRHWVPGGRSVWHRHRETRVLGDGEAGASGIGSEWEEERMERQVHKV